MEFLIKNFLISRIVRLDNFNIIAYLVDVCNRAFQDSTVAIGFHFPFGVGDVRFRNNNTQLSVGLAILIGDNLPFLKILFHMEFPFIDYSSRPLKNPAEIRYSIPDES